MYFILENYIKEHFTESLSGIMRFTYITDKMLEMHEGLLYRKIRECGIKTIHFTVSIFLTIFTTFIHNNKLFPVVDAFWDFFLVDGFNANVGILVHLLKLQKKEIFKLFDDELIIGIKKLG